jgi:hypothetical protein
VVYDNGNNETGNYNLTWFNLSNPCNATLSCGTTSISSHGSIWEEDFYTFSTSGEGQNKVLVHVGKAAGGTDYYPYSDLYNSLGIVSLGSDNHIITDPDPGDFYTVVIYDGQHNATGSYYLVWQKLNAPCNATSISCENPRSGSLSTAGERDFYTFTASANDSVVIRLVRILGSMNPYLNIYDSTGCRFVTSWPPPCNYKYNWYGGYDNQAGIVISLIAGRTYTIEVSDEENNDIGNYTLTLQNLNQPQPCNAATPITCGQTLPNSLVNLPQLDTYTFMASAGDKVRIRVAKTSGEMEPFLELYDSTGTWQTDYPDQHVAQIDKTIDAGGTYTVIVYDNSLTAYNGDYRTGNYNITLQSLKTPCNAPVMNCGQPLTASMSEVGEQDFYTFTVNGSDDVPVRIGMMPTLGYIKPTLSVYDSTGTNLGGYYVNSLGGYVEADRTGTSILPPGNYNLIVSDIYNEPTNTGDYTVHWQRFDDPCEAQVITCGETVSGSLDVPGEQGFWTFTANANDYVELTLARTTGYLYPCLAIYYPSGQRVFGDSCSSSYTPGIHQFTVPSDYNGMYVASVYNKRDREFRGGRGAYTLKFQKNTNPCPEVTVTSPNGGEIIQAGSTYTISWVSGSPAQEIGLSTDGGETFTTIATSPEGSQFAWSVPANLSTSKGRIRVTVTGGGISPSDDSDADFFVRPSVSSVSRNYTYDKLNRLTKITREANEIHYVYDNAGNLLTRADEETNSDGDTIPDYMDNCPTAANQSQADSDMDGFGDVCDNCPNVCNSLQIDADHDGIGDVCDPTPGCGGCGQPACEQQC